jgi:hypothetical protein
MDEDMSEELFNEIEFRQALNDLDNSREQRQIGMHAIASILWDYFNALQAQGFTSADAIYLTGRYHPLNGK